MPMAASTNWLWALALLGVAGGVRAASPEARPPGLDGVVPGAAVLPVPSAADRGPGTKSGLVPLAIPQAALDAAHAPRRVALVIGIQQFDDARWRPLRFPGADAAALAAVLRDPTKGGFDAVEVVASGPTREELRAALARLAALDRDDRDTVVVYVSSHGTLARDASGQLRRYLVARDTRVDDVQATGLSMDELKADFDRLRSRRKVLILATCHSGTGKSLLPEGVQRELAGIKAGFFVRPIEEVSRASIVLAASDWGETAREDEALGQDIYTHFLVEALTLGADRNGDGAVTASEAHDYARRMTYEYTHGEQRPSAESSEVGADAVVLVGKVARKGKPELYSYAPRLDGFTVRIDGHPLAELPGGVALEPGRHWVQVAKGSGPVIVDEQLRLGAGERVDVERLVDRADGAWTVGPRLAMLSFLDARSRAQVLAPVPALGAVAALRGWPARDMALRLDLATSAGTARATQGPFAAPYRYAAVTAGISLPWRFEPDALRGAALLAGPRLSAVWLQRRYDGLALSPGVQDYFTVTPGVVLGASLPAWRGIELAAELQLDWMLLKVNGQNRSSGFGELLLGMGWRF